MNDREISHPPDLDVARHQAGNLHGPRRLLQKFFAPDQRSIRLRAQKILRQNFREPRDIRVLHAPDVVFIQGRQRCVIVHKRPMASIFHPPSQDWPETDPISRSIMLLMHIDLNSDMGEIPAQIADGTQESLMRFITSVNIACGGHAGDERTMKTTIEQALRWNLTIGAHPGYPDRENFGRLELALPLSQIEESIHGQIRALAAIAETFATSIVHVKAHGALYNQAVHNADLARTIANAVARYSQDVVLVGLAGSPMLDIFRKAGFRVAAEAFADRQYEPDGTLRNRKFPDALIRDPQKAAEQAVRIATKKGVIASDGSTVQIDAQTICLHGDTPGAPQIAEAVANRLQASGVALRPLAV